MAAQLLMGTLDLDGSSFFLGKVVSPLRLSVGGKHMEWAGRKVTHTASQIGRINPAEKEVKLQLECNR